MAYSPESDPTRIDRIAWERAAHHRAFLASTAMLRDECRAQLAAGASKAETARRAMVSRVTLDAWLRD